MERFTKSTLTSDGDAGKTSIKKTRTKATKQTEVIPPVETEHETPKLGIMNDFEMKVTEEPVATPTQPTKPQPLKSDSKGLQTTAMVVEHALGHISDDLLVSNIKPKDEALRTLVDSLREYLDTDSMSKDITDSSNMKEVKEALIALPFDKTNEFVNAYLSIKHNKVSTTSKILDFTKKNTKLAIMMYFSLFILIWMILHVTFPNVPSPSVLIDFYNMFMDSTSTDIVIPD